MPPPAPSHEEIVLEPARFGDRLVALALDLALFNAGYVLSLIVLFLSLGTGAPSWAPRLLALAWLALFLAYSTVLTSGGRQTLGKRLLGLRVIDSEGGPPALAKAFLRAAGYLASALAMGLGFLWAFFHPRGCAWHDLLAGTAVVESRSKGPLARAAILLCAWLIFVGLAASWLWTFAGAPYRARMSVPPVPARP